MKFYLAAVVCLIAICISHNAVAQTKQPNILVIWGDDIGQFNISAYNRGMMGYRTPNIDRIAAEDLVASGVKVVLNDHSSSDDRYPNRGPLILVEAGVRLIDFPDVDLFGTGCSIPSPQESTCGPIRGAVSRSTPGGLRCQRVEMTCQRIET